jgi:UDP-N-acetylmuramoylalanine--D-glutamate ligase
MSAVTMPSLANKDPRLQNLAVLVIGLGKSGLAAARLALARGARVTIADRREEEEIGAPVEAARALGAALSLGGHPPGMASSADLVVLSPGVPMSIPLVRAARERGVPVWGEEELAFRFLRGRIVGITGSNGKSTTTSMAGAMLRAAGIPGGTGGNLGTPLSDLLAEDGPAAVHAVELSSFQLEAAETLRASVAVILNLSPDHLDRHESYDAYAAAKARILATQEPGDAAVLNADDPESARFFPEVRGALHVFSTRLEPERGAFLRDGVLTLRVGAEDEDILTVAEMPVPGEHNVANALAAALACRLAGCAARPIRSALLSFRSLPHRLEHVATVGGVEFYNDSKATNLDATVRAIGSFPPGRVHLILGGKDKGADWTSLAPLVRSHVRRVLLVGQAAPAVRRGLGDAAPAVESGTVPAAVRDGFAAAAAGDVVLLAPGCASFDQYRNFEERGEDFRRAVAALRAEEDGRA